MKMQIEVTDLGSIEIILRKNKFYLSQDKFFEVIAMQKNQEVSNSIYPCIYNTTAFKEFQKIHPELSVFYGLY